jgi:formylglycine-generating enzyme required for sulfatase activity
MGKYQVTQEEYQAVMGTNPSSFKAATNGENPARRPVERVSWYDAVEFCNRLSEMEGLAPYYAIDKNTRDPNNTSSYDRYKWLVTPNPFADGYRLPTEAQWEYALAGMPTVYDTGAPISGDTGWYWHNSGKKTHEVGLKPANAWGLHDMHGNVWEWCWDWYGSYSSEAQSDPVGPASGFQRVSRGESWEFDGKTYVMAWRYSPPNSRVSDHGFRLVRP